MNEQDQRNLAAARAMYAGEEAERASIARNIVWHVPEHNPNAGVRLVDTRPVKQYSGRSVWTPHGSLFLSPNQDWVDLAGRQVRGGRIPGTVHLYASRNLAEDRTYRRPVELQTLAKAAGVKPDQRVILYCGVGISASLGLFALHLAGYHDLALYDGSWIEWGSDPNRPLERDL